MQCVSIWNIIISIRYVSPTHQHSAESADSCIKICDMAEAARIVFVPAGDTAPHRPLQGREL